MWSVVGRRRRCQDEQGQCGRVVVHLGVRPGDESCYMPHVSSDPVVVKGSAWRKGCSGSRKRVRPTRTSPKTLDTPRLFCEFYLHLTTTPSSLTIVPNMSLTAAEKGKGRALPQDELEVADHDETLNQAASLVNSDSDSSESDSEDDSEGSDTSDDEEEISEEFMESLLEKARQNMSAKKQAAALEAEENDEVIKLGGDDSEACVTPFLLRDSINLNICLYLPPGHYLH